MQQEKERNREQQQQYNQEKDDDRSSRQGYGNDERRGQEENDRSSRQGNDREENRSGEDGGDQRTDRVGDTNVHPVSEMGGADEDAEVVPPGRFGDGEDEDDR